MGWSLWKSCQGLPICLATEILERLRGFLGARVGVGKLLCRFLMPWDVLQSPKSFPFLPSGSCQEMVGVSGPGPEQDWRQECAGSLRRNGCNVWTLGPGLGGAAQASHCSTPSALHLGRAGRAWKGQRLASGGRQRLQAPSTDNHAVNQHCYRGAKPLLCPLQ